MVKTAPRFELRSALALAPALLLAPLLAAVFADHASAQTVSTAADEAAIAEFNRKYLAAINDGDIDLLASLTTEGHMMIASGGPPLTGKQALVDSMTRAFQTTDLDETWEPQETVVSGDLAYQRGTFVVVVKPKDDSAQTRLTGNFLRIYRKIDGEWFMVRDSFNSQPPRNSQ